MSFVWSSVKNNPKISDIISEMVAILEMTSGEIRKPDATKGLSVTANRSYKVAMLFFLINTEYSRTVKFII
jgi:hypothetical protein